jgi:arylsulfatase A-like enzyme
MFILVIFLIKYRNEINNRINNEIANTIKVSTILLLICFVVLGVRIISTWVSADNTSHDAPNSAANSPNVILISFDALTAEDMPLYGYRSDTTPNMSNLAKDSYVFENTYSNSNWTKPGVTSILTGTYPSSHGLISASPFNSFPKKGNKGKNLPGYLKTNGYDTSAIVSNIHFAHPVLNDLHTSFNYQPLDTIEEQYVTNYWRSRKLLKIAPYFMAINSSAIQWIMMTIDHYPLLKRSFSSFFIKDKWETQTPCPAELTFAIAEKYLKTASGPLFTWVHVMPPHAPYLPPPKYLYSMLAEKSMDTNSSQEDLIQRASYRMDEQQKVDRLRLRYDESIRYADYEFGKFLEFLKASGYYDNSIIIITADHGESFEKNYLSHAGPWAYQPLIHIPLIIHLPKQSHGKRIKCNAEQVDIAPTIIDLLGMKDPGWFDGESLKRAMFGEYLTTKPKYSMNLQKNMSDKFDVLQSRSIAVIVKSYKYIYYIDKNYGELFDLSCDPDEKKNIVLLNDNLSKNLKELALEKLCR